MFSEIETIMTTQAHETTAMREGVVHTGMNLIDRTRIGEELWTVCVFYKTAQIKIFAFHIDMRTRERLGSLGFALAKGLIRGLVNRYPDPSPTTKIDHYHKARHRNVCFTTKHLGLWKLGLVPVHDPPLGLT